MRASKPAISAGIKSMVGILSNKAGEITIAKAAANDKMFFII